MFVSGLGSYSTAYNIVNISLAMVSMAEVYAQSERDKSLAASSMFVGMVAGQLGFGFIGDAVGLVRAFRLTMFLQVRARVSGVPRAGRRELCSCSAQPVHTDARPASHIHTYVQPKGRRRALERPRFPPGRLHAAGRRALRAGRRRRRRVPAGGRRGLQRRRRLGRRRRCSGGAKHL